MDIDLRTLSLIVVIANILQAFALSFLYISNKKYRGIGWWVLGSVMLATGFFLMLLRDITPVALLTIILSNVLMVSGFVFIYIGVMRFLDRRENHWIVVPPFLLFVVLFCYFTYAIDGINARTAIVSVFLSFYLFLTGSALLDKKPRAITGSAHFIAAVELFLMSFCIVRAGYVLFISPVESLYTATMVQTASFLFMFAGELLITIGLIIMVNQRLNADVSEAKEQFELFFHTSPDGIIISRFDNGNIVDINEGFTDQTGLARDDIIGSSCFDIHFWKNPDDEWRVIDEIREKGYCENFEAAILRKDGREFTGILSARIINLQNIPHVICVMRDITDRKRAEEALRQANQKLNMLSSITRHDILNQIMGIRGYLEISKEYVNDPNVREYMEIESNAVEKIQKQIEFTRYYQDIGVREPQWQNAGDIVNISAGNLNLNGITVNNSLEGLEIYADPLIEKVFYNLMENSLRHGEHVSTVHFSYLGNDDGLVISYRDNGVGISMENKKNLFEKGFGENTGLGLFLSREILSITGITITENGEAGKGVRFEMAVPEGVYRFSGAGNFKEIETVM